MKNRVYSHAVNLEINSPKMMVNSIHNIPIWWWPHILTNAPHQMMRLFAISPKFEYKLFCRASSTAVIVPSHRCISNRQNNKSALCLPSIMFCAIERFGFAKDAAHPFVIMTITLDCCTHSPYLPHSPDGHTRTKLDKLLVIGCDLNITYYLAFDRFSRNYEQQFCVSISLWHRPRPTPVPPEIV